MSELTGGRVNYYLAPVKHPQREDQKAYVAECEDIIQALDMDFNEACEFKAIWRTAAARQGNGKPGNKALYDAEKRLHYAGRSVRQLRLAQQDVKPVVHAWIGNDGSGPMNGDDIVEARLKDGTLIKGAARTFHWPLGSANGSIAEYRFID